MILKSLRYKGLAFVLIILTLFFTFAASVQSLSSRVISEESRSISKNGTIDYTWVQQFPVTNPGGRFNHFRY